MLFPSLKEVVKHKDDDADEFNVNKLFPAKKHNWKKFDPNAHPWIGTQYSDTKQERPWFIHNGQGRRKPHIPPYGTRAAGANRYNRRYQYPNQQQNPYWTQQQYANQQQPSAQSLPGKYLQMDGYQAQTPASYPAVQPQGYQAQQPGIYQSQPPASYQEPQTNSYQNQPAAQTPVSQQYATGLQANQAATQNVSPTTACPATCTQRCTTACPEECCAKYFEKVAEKEAGPSSFVSDCPTECKVKCGIHCPQKCCGLSLCPFECRTSCMPGCPKRCCIILKEFLPPLALPPLKLSAAICPGHCSKKCSTDCPQACCSKSEIPEKTTKCPSICLKVSMGLDHRTLLVNKNAQD